MQQLDYPKFKIKKPSIDPFLLPKKLTDDMYMSRPDGWCKFLLYTWMAVVIFLKK